jgi:hypothetical protein
MSLVSDAEKLSANDAYYSEYMSCLAIERALGLRKFQDAWTIATAASYDKAYSGLRMRKQAMAALAAHELGWKRQARNLIQRTIHQCELRGDAVILKEVCSIGAAVTGDARLKERAKELGQLLTA